MSFSFLELPIWVQFEILLRIAPDDFCNFAITNKDIATLTSGKLTQEQKLLYGNQITDRLYRERSERFYRHYDWAKKEDMSWREFYFRIYNVRKGEWSIERMNKYASAGKFMEVEVLSIIIIPNQDTLDNAVKAGCSINFLNSLHHNYGLIPDILNVTINGQLHILRWLNERWNGLITLQIANLAAEHGHIHILEFLNKNDLPMPNEYGVGLAVTNRRLDVLKWMKLNSNLPTPTSYSIHSALSAGYYDILKWLQDNNISIYDQYGIEKAAINGKLDILKLVSEKHLISIDQITANCIASAGHLHILKWLKENNMTLPDIKGSVSAERNKHLHVLKWIHENNLPLRNKTREWVSSLPDSETVASWLK